MYGSWEEFVQRVREVDRQTVRVRVYCQNCTGGGGSDCYSCGRATAAYTHQLRTEMFLNEEEITQNPGSIEETGRAMTKDREAGHS